jgi:radical SAM/Cys-rich protein
MTNYDEAGIPEEANNITSDIIITMSRVMNREIGCSITNTSKFEDRVRAVHPEPLTARGIKILQVNVGYQCNMACRHCHVSAGPLRSEAMDGALVDNVLRVLQENPIETLDITGGAPELNPYFRRLVTDARNMGKRVISRTNLTIVSEPGMSDLPEFYRDHDVELIASLPCYLEENITAVRGRGAFQKSMDALRRLNAQGFGVGSDERPLSLVYNPAGAFLPPLQSALEADYKRELKTRYGISFTRLYAFTNMPIGRFREALVESGNFTQYIDMLASTFNPDTLNNIMCRNIVSVGWDGSLYDCDFNQVLSLALSQDAPRHIRDFDYEALLNRRIAVGDHCFGCTAGQGST